MKTCTVCGIPKELEDFGVKSRATDGRRPECRACQREHGRDYYSRHKEEVDQTHREYYAANKVNVIARTLQHRAHNRGKDRAHWLVSSALRSGRLTKLPCEVCGSLKSEAHHEDYAKPLQVNWLCKLHHRERERQCHTESTGTGSTS